ncbi:YcbK family protein [Maritalea mediterranea]|uniref:D-Ala-D-Ala carboxypeptidase family metallohydrolase n=1 Tax=Maritalea mediterranea TaxID=2909667 RepID=A0ABS9E8J8_9HYPH|nr:D-Ala-D-Ala carboxypeptidase family metallohydrolase [Maritalea mediterranea]MCF4098234.1 D-Ala-D-Ala carboxypeptidase family metallohydrolase [Maritalea mediterranea]
MQHFTTLLRPLLAALITSAILAGCASLGGFDASKHYDKKYGIYVANDDVNTFCLLPKLRYVLWKAELRFGRPVVVSSGFRNPIHNFMVGGAWGSYHQKCMAADIFIPGVSKSKLIAFMRTQSQVGGLGCYPGRKFIHVDIRGRPSGYKQPVQFKGC